MKELKVGERVTVTLEVVEQDGCDGCFFGPDDTCHNPTVNGWAEQYYCRDKSGMEQLKRRAIESVYDEILKGMKANGLISISQYKDIYTNSTIYEGTCSIYKNK